MKPDLDADAYADSVLVAVLRYLAFRSKRQEAFATDRALSELEAELVDDRIRRCMELATRIKKGGATSEDAARAYATEREAIDSLWDLVAQVGVPALLDERDRRVLTAAYLR